MRSSLISASTMTENGFDMLRAVVENDLEATQDALDEARDEALLLNAEDVRSKRRQEEVKIFMAFMCCCLDCGNNSGFSSPIKKILSNSRETMRISKNYRYDTILSAEFKQKDLPSYALFLFKAIV